MDREELFELLALALLNAAVIALALWVRLSSAGQRGRSRYLPSSPWSGVFRRPAALGSGARAGAATAAPAPIVPASDGHALPIRDETWPATATTEWASRIRAETIRCHRSGRRASIVYLRLEGLGALTGTAGAVAGSWLCRIVGAYLRASGHEKDLVQDDHGGTFRVLLVDTNEEGARAYVESVSKLLTPRLDDPRAEIRLIAGWAGSGAEADLEATQRLAQARLSGASEGWIRSTAAWTS